MAFDGIEYTINNLNWYRFPIEVQQMYPFIIANVQQPIELDVFGSITCSRKDFQNVREIFYHRFTLAFNYDNLFFKLFVLGFE